jgi:cytochrome P450
MQVFSSYRQVSQALRHPALGITATDIASTGPHAAVREAGAEFAHSRLDLWKDAITQSVRERALQLPGDRPVDLFADFAAPISLDLAGRVTGISAQEADAVTPRARKVFLAAAHASMPGTDAHALDAALDLARSLPPSPMAVQGFVALSHTLPHFLVSGWDAMVSDGGFLSRLRDDIGLLPKAIEELLRFASPARAVFRVALEPLQIEHQEFAKGEEFTLMLSAANRDPLQFTEPDRLDLDRDATAHLAFGKGSHSCAGAHLIRIAAVTATRELLQSFPVITRTGEPEWLNGFAIRAPSSLPVLLKRQP